jgi:hypothetical protein
MAQKKNIGGLRFGEDREVDCVNMVDKTGRAD